MELQVDIRFNELLKAVKSLPSRQLKKLKAAIEEEMGEKKQDLEQLLLNGPVATKEQLQVIENNRKAINAWRTK